MSSAIKSIICFSWIFIWGTWQLACVTQKSDKNTHADFQSQASGVEMTASDKALEASFNWAKNRALSYAHDGSDPVGYWYEAALPNREAFCMRDVSHQAIGAEILGLSQHNHNMMLKFAQNINEDKDFCSYWEINRHDKPAPVDFETNRDFWYNLPANFDVIYNAYRLFNWTGNQAYLDDPDFRNFYELSLNQYVARWQLGGDEVVNRARHMNSLPNTSNRFGDKRGIPTYNEGGRGETKLGIDMTASLIAAYRSYSRMLKLSGDIDAANVYAKKAEQEAIFLDEFWWDHDKQIYRSIWYEDESFDHFMVGSDQAFLHYLYYFDVIADQARIQNLMDEYRLHFDELIVELKSYLPILFYENGQTRLANQMIIDLCSSSNERRDYPENSFTIIEHITRGLMGINVDASSNSFSTLSRLNENEDWAELTNVPLLSNDVSVKHFGKVQTSVKNERGPLIKCKFQFSGKHENLYVDGHKKACIQGSKHGQPFSYIEIDLDAGDMVIVSTAP